MKILDKLASIIIDPSNSKRSSSAQALSWAVTIILGVGSLGLVQWGCLLWRQISPVEKNDTHEKVGQIFRKFFPKPEAKQEETPPQAASQANQTVADQPSAGQTSAEIPKTTEESATRATSDKSIEKSSSQEKTTSTEKPSPTALPSVQKDSQQTMVTAPTPTPTIQLPPKPSMPALDVYVEVDSDGYEPFVNYLKTKSPPECRFHLVKLQSNPDTKRIEHSDDIQNRKDLIYIYVARISGRADSERNLLTSMVTERGLLNIISILLSDEEYSFSPISVADYQKLVESQKTQSVFGFIGQLQGQEARVYGNRWNHLERWNGGLFPKVLDDKHFKEMNYDGRRFQEPIATPISEIGPAIAKYQKALFEEQEREKKEQNS